MLRLICHAKIQGATVTEANLHYEGSLTLDEDLMDAAGLLAYEQIHVLNVNNGARVETYVIPGERGSGVVCLNGPAARSGVPGDKLIVLAYALCNEDEARSTKLRAVYVDADNRQTGRRSPWS